MNKEEIRHFKALLRQGSLRHMNIILDDKFQKELLDIIKDYEHLQQELTKYKERNESLSKQLQNISNEFLKYNWKEATQEQTYNQLKSLYESILQDKEDEDDK